MALAQNKQKKQTTVNQPLVNQESTKSIELEPTKEKDKEKEKHQGKRNKKKYPKKQFSKQQPESKENPFTSKNKQTSLKTAYPKELQLVCDKYSSTAFKSKSLNSKGRLTLDIKPLRIMIDTIVSSVIDPLVTHHNIAIPMMETAVQMAVIQQILSSTETVIKNLSIIKELDVKLPPMLVDAIHFLGRTDSMHGRFSYLDPLQEIANMVQSALYINTSNRYHAAQTLRQYWSEFQEVTQQTIFGARLQSPENPPGPKYVGTAFNESMVKIQQLIAQAEDKNVKAISGTFLSAANKQVVLSDSKPLLDMIDVKVNKARTQLSQMEQIFGSLKLQKFIPSTQGSIGQLISCNYGQISSNYNIPPDEVTMARYYGYDCFPRSDKEFVSNVNGALSVNTVNVIHAHYLL